MSARAWVVAVMLAALAAALADGPDRAAAETDHRRELAGVEHALASEGGAAERLRLLHRRALLSGSADAYRELEAALRAAPDDPDVPVYLAQLCLQLHRLPEAEELLATLGDRPEAWGLRADLAQQRCRYEEARALTEAALERERSWEALARLAHLRALAGDLAGADALYAEAADEITVREMRAYAWVELNRGRLDLAAGRLGDAEAHYDRAGRAYSGWWLVDEHRAELLAAQGRNADAIALYRALLARSPRPELEHALGDLYAFAGRAAEARAHHERALAGYLASAERGEVHLFHHIASFYADVRQDGERALAWALRDLELRPGPATYDAVAWAHLRAGRLDEARAAIERALAFPVEDAHVLAHAARISVALGRHDEAARLRERLDAIHPRYAATFHVHR
jgi:tetratricopeptide (TPR) repeat protein